MGIIRDSFVIFKHWASAIEVLPEEYQLETYKALVSYGVNSKIPENISPVAQAMLISFSKDMETNIAKYNASVENGKKGGNPNFKKGQANPYYNKNEDNQDITEDIIQDNQKITQDNQDITLYDNVYVNDNVNVINSKLVNNKNNIFENYIKMRACVRVCVRNEEERKVYLEKYKTFFDYHHNDKFSDAAYEIIDTMIEAKEQSETNKGLVFKSKKYSKDRFEDVLDKLTYNQFENIISQLVFNEEIENRPAYILGCLIESYKLHSG